MKDYTVYFLIKDIVSLTVSAKDGKEAEEKASEKLQKEMYKNSSLECVDGKTKFAGFNIDEVWFELDN